MKMSTSRVVRHLICLASLLTLTSTPLLAQRGIDLLDPDQVRRAAEAPVGSAGAETVRVVSGEGPNSVLQADHERKTLKYDDGSSSFDNHEGDDGEPSQLPVQVGSRFEAAQLFELEADSIVMSVEVCFYRPRNRVRQADYTLRFYSNDDGTRADPTDNPDRRSGLAWRVEGGVRRAGDFGCVALEPGWNLRKGMHWVGIEPDPANSTRLAEDHYTSEDEAETDRNDEIQHVTEVRYRSLDADGKPVGDGDWMDPRENRCSPTDCLKAIGVRLSIVEQHAKEPDDTPDSEPDPDPGVIVPPPTGAGYSACRPTVAPLTLEGDVKVSLCYQAPNGDMDDASAVYRSDNSGLLYFFEPDNAEVFVKVLDGCGINRHRWVYVAPLTDVAFNMYINDGRNPTWTYFNKAGDQGEIRANLMAFPCAP